MNGGVRVPDSLWPDKGNEPFIVTYEYRIVNSGVQVSDLIALYGYQTVKGKVRVPNR